SALGTDFGSPLWGSALTNIFAITNSGNTNLTISGVTTNGAGAASFSIAAIPVTVSVGGKSNFTVRFTPLNAGSYTAALQMVNNSTTTPYIVYLAGTGAKHDQTITNFTPTNGSVFAATSMVGLAALASSGLPVTNFIVGSGPGTISGLTNLTFSGSGTVSVITSQAGNTNWNSTPAVTNTFNVTKANQAALTFSPTTPQTYNTTNGLGASGGSGAGALSYVVLSGPGEIVGLTNLHVTSGAGIVVVTTTRAADDMFNAKTATGTVVCVKADQAITFPAIADQIVTARVGLAATTSSGLEPSFAVSSGPGSVTGGTNLSFTVTGVVSIVAFQAGNTNWNSAPSVTNTFTVSKANQAITFSTIADQLLTATLSLNATAGSGLTVSFAVGSGPAIISGGNSLSFSDTGRVSIVASQSGNALWNAALDVTNSFNVTAVAVTSLGIPQNVTATDGTLTGRVMVTWSAVTGADGYEIWDSPVNNIGTALSAGPSTTTTYTDTSAEARAGLMKYYWLRAWNTVATGAFSAVENGYGLPNAGVAIISGQPAVGDYDGDNKADPAVYHLNSGRLYAWISTAAYSLLESAITFHLEPGELPALGDYDGDNYIDAGVFRATAGVWYVWLSSAGYAQVGPALFGVDANDIPVAGDYDGDAKTDPGVYHGTERSWYIWLSSGDYARLGPLTRFHVGPADIPAPGDYDGDGKADPAVYQSVAGTWYVWLSSAGYDQFGPVTFATTDAHLTVPADYDGDNKCDPATYLPALGKWRLWMSGSDYSLTEME
ncbi:MAG: choice-of-anchor D domain-containing protein, partial [Lentisphaerae bacterium]|nr:choice-of-anchor D domain-containing protein [Lentisphaerota bacterium]